MLYHECLGYDCECYYCRSHRHRNPELNREFCSGCISLRWSRDEIARHFNCVILFRSVQAYFLSTVAEDNCGLGLGELTFLQLSTTYLPVAAGRSVGYVLFRGLQRAEPKRV